MSTEIEVPLSAVTATSQISGYVVVSCSYQNTDSLERFFAQADPKAGMCFFVCADLPLRQSIRIYELLKNVSLLPVYALDSTLKLEPNAIYLCPSFSHVSLVGDQLTVEANRANLRNRSTFSLMLSALAQKGDRAALVSIADTPLLESSSLIQFRRCGGLVLEEEQEEFGELDSEVVDRILSIESMQEALKEHFGMPELPASEKEKEEQVQLRRLFDLLSAEVSVDFSFYKGEVLMRRVSNRMRRRSLKSLSEYVDFACSDLEEPKALYNDFIVGNARFFRDEDVVATLREKVIPELFASHTDRSEIRVWVAGVASGEEAFSLAILLEECAEEHGIEKPKFKIFATDVHQEALRKGVQAYYSAEALQGLSPQRLERYFKRAGSGFVVNADLRRKVVFARHDILRDPPFSRLDFVCCRNLLSYLKPSAQKKAIGMILFSLKLKGYLCLGSAETPNSYQGQLETYDNQARIFLKKSDTYVSPTLLSPSSPIAFTAGTFEATATPLDQPQLSAVNAIMERFMPPSIVIDELGEIVHTFGDCDRFLRPMEGRVSLHYEDRVRPELKLTLHQLRSRALRSQSKVLCRCMIVASGGPEEEVPISMEPLKGLRQFDNCVLVVFGDERAVLDNATFIESLPEESKEVEAGEDTETALRSELQLMKLRLHETVQQLETSNHELQLANEELLTSNEELQTTNEELHSVNEELFSVNAEYESKNRDLISLNEDINNLLSSTEIGTVFVDKNLRIRKFTPAAHSILNLLPSDLGRPIDHVSHNLVGYDSLVEDTKTVIEGGKGLEREARMEDGRLLLVRILPFTTGKEEVTGAVIALIDITDLKRAEIQFMDSQRRLQLALEAADFGVWSFDPKGGHFECDSRVERFLCFKGDLEQSRKEFLKIIESTVEDFLRQAGMGQESKDSAFQESWQFAGSDGQMRYLSTRAIVYRGPAGGAERVSGVLWDETDSKRGEQLVLQKKKDLETLLYVVSHDLREPLRAIQSFSALLNERFRENLGEKGIDFLNRIQGASNRMTALLDDVLSLSRINKMHAPMDRVSGGDLVEAALKELEKRIQDTDAKILVSSDLPELKANYTYAKQALTNLIGNALKFVNPGEKPEIEITPYVSKFDHIVGIEVRDRGPGIPEESLDRVFKLFQRAVGRDVEGTGAGLAIVKQIAQKHGGDVWYEPRSGGGAKFAITFSKNI
ncbi:CheR family methyltransferase [Pelagicoccus sp. SDUM812005]|uniref:CheR family methyltransferase n=1 Tax=Pelagicoccus sp. SDUM812005 TaxID=3041257 RepID=UPI00280D1F49|nr:CheR family methyltransferase [Pelagicoccus sp. SDUM812005]MDQ8181224.1 CheR family methyltransferase [Pelagicoccus sp. SDUM812005]